MKVKEISLTEEGEKKMDYRSYYEIQIDGKKAISFMDGEPEDATLNRDFNDVYYITELMQRAYNAGKGGEVLVFEKAEIDEV